jgi:ankyrin repeat protein
LVKEGDTAAVEAALKEKPDLALKKYSNGFTLLHDAAYWGQRDVAEVLLKYGADVNARTKDGVTPLINAVSPKGSTELAILLVKNGADLHATANNGATALHNAATYGDSDLAIFLLESGADVNARANNGATPLDSAALYGKADLVRILLNYGADVHAKANNGATAASNAQAGGHWDIFGVLSVPIGQGNYVANPAESIDELPASDPMRPICKAILAGEAGAVEAMLKEHPELATGRIVSGQTPLHLAAWAGSRGITDLLLADKADVDARDLGGLTPLHVAARRGQMDVAAVLLAHGADVNALTPYGTTPLLYAAARKHDEMVGFLRQNGGVLTMNDKFAAVDTVAVLPLLDGRSDKRASVNLDKLRSAAVKVLEKKHYSAVIADNPPPGQRWVMEITLVSLSRWDAEFAGVLCDATAIISSSGCRRGGREFWSGSSAGEFRWSQPTPGTLGYTAPSITQAAATLTDATWVLLGLSKGDAEAEGLLKLMGSFPERPKGK